MFLYFLLFALGLVSGSVIMAVIKVGRKDEIKLNNNHLNEKLQAEDDNPFEEDKEIRKYKEKFINFFS